MRTRTAPAQSPVAIELNLYPEAIEARRAEGYDVRAAPEWALADEPAVGLEETFDRGLDPGAA